MNPINIHPMLVHFPIALLTLYAVLEIARLRILTQWESYFSIRAVLVILGSVSAVAARQAGDLIEHSFEGIPSVARVVELHSTLATLTTILFCVIAALYAIVWAGRLKSLSRLRTMPGFVVLERFSQRVIASGWVLVLVVPGLVLLTLTGALGGIITSGPDTDPVTKLVYQLFFQ